MLSFIQNLFKKEKLNYQDLKSRDAIIIDVRTPEEFAKRHADHSINIPLNEIKNHIEEIKLHHKPVIMCCRSGARSGIATKTLINEGVEVYNGGSWKQVQAEVND